MAFGTWLKNIIGKVGSAIKKVLPIAKKVIGAVAPAVQQIGGMIGGPIGTGIQKIAGGVSKFVDKADMFVNGSNPPSDNANLLGGGGAGIHKTSNMVGSHSVQPTIVGANGAGIRRLTPMLKG